MKKTLAVILALAVLCIMAVGGTMSYLTYTDYDVNTMAVGNVSITQNEQKRDGTNFVDCPLLPVTAKSVDVDINGSFFSMVPQDKNGVDKIVTITNAANSQSAYIRTLFAFEKLNSGSPFTADGIVIVLNDSSVGTWEDTGFTYTDKSGVEHVVYAFTYEAELAAGATSAPSLLQVYLSSTAGNEFYNSVGAEYTIHTLSQAVQKTGFGDADEAFDAAFKLTQDNVQAWFAAKNT